MATDHVKTYLAKFESQHKERPRLMAHAETLLDLLDGAYETLHSAPEKFNLATATGKQLDMIGNRVGAPRTVEIPGSALYPTGTAGSVNVSARSSKKVHICWT